MKTESKIPTAKDLIAPIGGIGIIQQVGLEILMQEFAKLHVEAALKAAAEKAELMTLTFSNPDPNEWEKRINSASILNAYPTDNIK